MSHSNTSLSFHARSTPEKAAIIVAESGAITTYEELNRKSIQCARLFAEQGLGFGDHIALMVENLPEALVVAWAAFRSGLYVTPVNWHLKADEAAYVVNDSMAKLVVISPGVEAITTELDQCISPEVGRWSLGGSVGAYRSLEKAWEACSGEPLEEEWQGTMMFYSSGTTGKPKGILNPLERHSTDSEPDPLWPLIKGLYGFSEETVYLCPTPLYHAAPIAWSMTTLRLGGTVVLMQKFDARQALQSIERFRVNRAQFVPTMFVRMLDIPEDERARYDVSSLEVAVHAAAPCAVVVKHAMMDWWGPVIYEYYAGSEGVGFTAIEPQEWLEHPGSVGRPMTGPVHILDNQDNELAVGEVGAIYFETDSTFSYHGDEDKTRDSYSRQGWSTLGDVGYVDEEGYLYLTDRRSNMIISGGVNIYPQEAENVLINHPSVFDVAVIGVPHPEFGESVKAVVQLYTGINPSNDRAAELIEYCQQYLTKYKCPRSVDFVAELPRLPSGKLLKRELLTQYR
ncbi:MAG: acyl-CoA synthetase [Halioglobus sp.]|nr:acyl-CoA synthetase [Halioglobus sp.]